MQKNQPNPVSSSVSKGANIYMSLLVKLHGVSISFTPEQIDALGGYGAFKLLMQLLLWGNRFWRDRPEGTLEVPMAALESALGVKENAIRGWRKAAERAGFVTMTRQGPKPSLWQINLDKLKAFLGVEEAPKTVRYPQKKRREQADASTTFGQKKAFHAAMDAFFKKCSAGVYSPVGGHPTERVFLREIRKVNVGGTLLIDWLRQDEKGQNSARFLIRKLWPGSSAADIEEALTNMLDKDYDPEAKRKERIREQQQRRDGTSGGV